MSLSELTSLQQTLNNAIDAFKTELATQGLPEPSLTTSKPHPTDSIAYLPSPVMYNAMRTILSSLALIKTLVIAPYDALAANTYMGLEAASLRLAADVGLATVLNGHEHGLSIQEIVAQTNVDGLKLERVIRLLVTQDWFRETKPGFFANNRLSNIIKNDQPGWHLATYMNELVSKVAIGLPGMVNHSDAEFRKSREPQHTAFQVFFQTDLPYFGPNGWLMGHPEEATRFGPSMGAVGPTSDPGVTADFPWAEIAKGKDAIVDVGGSQGTLCCSIAEKYPEIGHFIVQDLPESREAAEAFIASKGLSHKVKFEAQDFFKPQQRKGKYVFVMQRVLHDWNTEDAAKMLRNMCDVLNEDSCLLIIDTIIEPGVVKLTGAPVLDSLSKTNKERYEPIPPPEFIPTNFGDASRYQHLVDVGLIAICNAFERSLPQLQEMVELGGLKIKKVHATRSWASITEVEVA